MSDFHIVRDLLKTATLVQWPRLTYYFFGRAMRSLTGITLFRQLTLKVGGISFVADVSGMSGLVFLHQIYCQRIYDFNWKVENGTVFDVGANCGFFSLVLCHDRPQLHCLCFEPHPMTCHKLRANVKCNHLNSRIEVIEAAVGARAGQCDFEISSHSSMGVVSSAGAHLSDSQGRKLATTRVSVPIMTMDEFAEKRNVWPDLIKIDVEGFELPVLEGAAESLRRARAVIVEFDSDASCQACGEILRNAGFDVTRRESIYFARRPA